MITQQTIQQITNRIDIVEIVGEFVKLKKRGANYLGNCPFHNEKSPSFTVSPSKEIYKCFGCGKSGNAIGFVMEHEKYTYVEALKWIAARYNIEIEETVTSPEVKQQQQVAESLLILNSFAQKYFSKNLTETEEGQSAALSYLKHRGFREEVIEKFQLGYNLEAKDDLVTILQKSQFSLEVAQKAGLVTNRNDSFYDSYRGRIIFPIHNQSGKIIGFGARVIKSNEKAPKYINTPENEVYVKSKILYGTYFARQAINKFDECLLVEGYTDVVSLHQAGIENVVASGGTSLTIDQLRLIRKHTNNLTIIYDGDSAGVKAALRGLDMALEEGLNVKLVLIPDNEDPDSYVKKIGATPFRAFVDENKKDFIIFQLEVMLKDAGNDTAKKSAVVNQVAETLSKFHRAEDFTKQQDYIRQCSGILKIDEGGLTTLVNKLKREKITKEENRQVNTPDPYPVDSGNNVPAEETSSLLINDEYQERNLLRALLEYGLLSWDEERTMADFIFEELEHYSIEDPNLDSLLQVYKDYYYKGLQPSTKTLLYDENDNVRKLAVLLSIQQYELSPRWDSKMEGMNINNRDVSRQDVTMSLNYFKLRKIKKMFDENQRDIEKAASFEEQMDLIKIHNVLKDEEQKITRQLGTVIFK
ncbi:DNA primase [Segetibacter aerophilus]|uniref:DNA primase n=1 Tax=Segetibacter aerophilus TaxID=670293 RepID=A0A512B847_9BACT|nr:DNA primase [Segetibacter aerophilus]GEO08142.1 DNA primase [Segetibacter aerophilus]